MKNLGILCIFSLVIISCAGNKKTSQTSHETEMVKVEKADSAKKIVKTKMSKSSKKEIIKNNTPKTANSSFTCSAGSDVRELEITPVDSSGCELKYTKNGETKTIANANFNVSYCEEVQQRIVKKLETAGFNCQ